MPNVPTCTYCLRSFADPRGCDWQDGDPKPPTYGSECHPMATGPTCYDCGAPKGRDHHAYCLACECVECHRQFHPGMTCAEDAALSTGGQAA